jgi:hypothetical protein
MGTRIAKAHHVCRRPLFFISHFSRIWLDLLKNYRQAKEGREGRKKGRKRGRMKGKDRREMGKESIRRGKRMKVIHFCQYCKLNNPNNIPNKGS